MRSYSLALALFIFSTNISSQKPAAFHITGSLSSAPTTGTVYLYYPVKGGWAKDSSQLTNGAFSITASLSHPTLATLEFQNTMKEIFLEPANLKVIAKTGDLSQAQVLGSISQKDYEQLNGNIQKIQTRWQSVLDTLSAVNKRSNTAFQELRDWVLNPYFEEIRETYLDFFKKKPRSFVTAYYLSMNVIEMNQGNLPNDSLQAYYNRFPSIIKNSLYGEQIAIELAKRQIAVPGKQAIDFTKTDSHGEPVSLSSFLGKYVLLDFWGSWCVPCRKGHPHLKEIYTQYKDKGFDIIGIAADNDTRDAWLKAIQNDGLPWRQILVDNLESVYNITSYPTRILIDNKGKIIGRFSSDESELELQLRSIFD